MARLSHQNVTDLFRTTARAALLSLAHSTLASLFSSFSPLQQYYHFQVKNTTLCRQLAFTV